MFDIAKNNDNMLINDQIKCPQVLVIGPNGEQVGVKPIGDKEAMKKQRANMSELKEYRLSPVIDVGDFETKLRNATKYLEKGDRIKLSVRFKGRQMAHTELGKEVLDRFAERVNEIADVEQKPKLEGRQMTMLLVPKKDK